MQRKPVTFKLLLLQLDLHFLVWKTKSSKQIVIEREEVKEEMSERGGSYRVLTQRN